MRDVVIIGGGPAGLSAALNGAAEGLDVVLLESLPDLGGQAGTSSRIENYLGWPGGVSGSKLTRQASRQAIRLGAELRSGHGVSSVEFQEATGFWVTTCVKGVQYLSHAVIVAVGVDYRKLSIPGGDADNVLYGAPAAAHDECHGLPVVVIGGGNSAGQAALNLARIGAHVTLLARRPLKATMSRYLIERIATDDRITATLGDPAAIDTDRVVRDGKPDIPAAKVFAYIGSTPRTDFIHHCCDIEGPGYVRTDDSFAANRDGLFVAGDVRVGSFKRVAAAVGEGAIAAASAWRHIYQ